MRRLLLTLAALLAVIAATLVSSPTASAEDEMGVEKAGRYYLKGACKNAAAGDHFYDTIWGNRKTIPVKEVQRRLPELKRESARYARAIQKWATTLFNPPAPWPAAVARDVDKLAEANVKFADYRSRQSRAADARGWINANAQANKVSFGHYATRIRARLGLPPTGQGC